MSYKITKDTLSLSSNNYKISNIFINKFSFFFLLFFFLYLFIYSGYIDTFWWNHLFLNNFLLGLIILVNFFIVFTFFFLSYFFKINEVIKYDYFFSMAFLSIFLSFIFFSNTLFTFIFILESISTVIFFKFVSSKIWKNQNSIIDLKANNSYKKFLNILFFQFWTTFFSTVIFIFFFMFLIYNYGTSEWFILNFLNIISQKNFSNSTNLFFFYTIFFFLGFFLKIGFTPIHLYKIEIYKGLPFLSIFLYTTIYFLIFFLYFLLIIFFYLKSFFAIFYYFMIFLVLISFFYLLFLIFDINYSKSFFAYSTISNSLTFVIVSLIVLI